MSPGLHGSMALLLAIPRKFLETPRDCIAAMFLGGLALSSRRTATVESRGGAGCLRQQAGFLAQASRLAGWPALQAGWLAQGFWLGFRLRLLDGF